MKERKIKELERERYNKSKEKIPNRVSKKSESGITLIAIIVTIIILIILAVISMNTLFGEKGLMKKTENARDLHYEAEANEMKNINTLYDQYMNELKTD